MTVIDNQDATTAMSYSNSVTSCTKTWDRSKKVASSVPFIVSCTVNAILKTGQTRRETVTREKLINFSNIGKKP